MMVVAGTAYGHSVDRGYGSPENGEKGGLWEHKESVCNQMAKRLPTLQSWLTLWKSAAEGPGGPRSTGTQQRDHQSLGPSTFCVGPRRTGETKKNEGNWAQLG